MNDHLKQFANHAAYQAAESNLYRPNVSLCVSENEVHYNPIPHDYSQDYFTIISLEDDNTISWYHGTSNNTNYSYSIDNGQTWISITQPEPWETEDIITLNQNEKILLKGTNTALSDSDNYHDEIRSSDIINVEGNIMSLLYGDNFVNQTTLPATNTFNYLFQGSYIINAENLVLPATTLTDYCYFGLFKNSRLEIPPKILPATVLATQCYDGMFQGTSITESPYIPNITYSSSTDAFDNMFYNCTYLNRIKCLIKGSNTLSLWSWVYNVSQTGTFIKNQDAQWTTGSNGIPSGWTIETASE